MCAYNSAKARLSLMFASMFERLQMHCEFEKGGDCHLQSTYSHSEAFQLVRKTFLSVLCTLPIPSPSTTLYLVQCGIFPQSIHPQLIHYNTFVSLCGAWQFLMHMADSQYIFLERMNKQKTILQLS